MIQIYIPTNTNYSVNGDAVLDPVECTVEAELKDTWEMYLECPRDPEGKWKNIVTGAVVAAPTFMGKKQLFRLYEVNKTEETVQAYGRPIFLDAANNVFLQDVRPVQCNGQQALDWMMNGTSYSGESDITTINTAYYVRQNLIEALNGNESNSFVKRWGGEPLYDNYTVILNARAGADNGVQILHRKNITGIEATINEENVITRIYPLAYNGRTLPDTAPYVNSPLIGSYPIVHATVVKFENIKLRSDLQGDPQPGDIVFETLADVQNALIAACQDMYDDNCDVPDITLNVSMVDLAQTEEYKDYVQLETVTLGDTVHVKYSDLDVDVQARVLSITWDCIHDCIQDVVIGDAQYDYFTQMNTAMTVVGEVVDTNGNVYADRVRGTLDLLNTRLKLQQGVAEHQTVRAILFEDLDPESSTYGALCIGTQGIEISHTRNQAGTDWVWGTAIDSQTIHAENIVTGILSDQRGYNYWDLDSGDFRLATAGVTVDGQVLDDYIANIASHTSGMTMHLTSEFVGVNPDPDGYCDVTTTVIVYYGQQDVTADCSYGISKTSGVTGNWNTTTHTYQVTRLTTDTGSVQITATYQGILTVKKTFDISKISVGADGRAYTLDASQSVVSVLNQNGDLSAQDVVFNAWYFEGTSVNRQNYNGRFRIEETQDGVNYTTIYESEQDESEVQYLFAAFLIDYDDAFLVDNDEAWMYAAPMEAKEIRCTLYAEGGFDVIMGRKTVVFIREAAALTQDEAFNILTNNGEIMGIYKEGNILMINANYIGTGKIISPRNPQNYWDLDTGELSISSSTKINGSDSNTIGTIDTRITNNASGLQSEITARQSGDSSLSTRITQTHNEIVTEVTNRTTAESELSTKITQNATSITTEVKDRKDAVSGLDSRITQNATSISTEVTDRQKEDNKLSSRITQNATSISSKITSAQAESLITQKADSIRLKADKIAWKATNSRMTEDGKFWAQEGDFTGAIHSTSGSIGGATIASEAIYTGGRHALDPSSQTGVLTDGFHLSKYGFGVYKTSTGDYTLLKNGTIQVYSKSSGQSCGVYIQNPSNGIRAEYKGDGLTLYSSGIYATIAKYLLKAAGSNVESDGTITAAIVEATVMKPRVIDTKDYGRRYLYAFETTSPMFGDIGEGIISDDGQCRIYIDPVFAQTVQDGAEYQVFLQAYGQGECYIQDRKHDYFVVCGAPGLKFGWEMKTKQIDTGQHRLESRMPNEEVTAIDYGQSALDHITDINNERRAA